MAGLASSFDDGRVLRDGLVVAIVGKTNVGKSSLLNALLEAEKAIVTAVPGTTRDVIEETLSLSGLTLRIVDTAGIQEWRNIVEREGIRRTKNMIREADLVLLVVDQSRKLSAEDEEIFRLVGGKRNIVVLNKTDLRSRLPREAIEAVFPKTPFIKISAHTGEGVGKLRERIHEFVVQSGMSGLGGQTVVMAARHKRALEEALEAVDSAKKETRRDIASEIVAMEIKSALGKLGEIVGETVSEDVLDKIFSQFCIGK